MMTTKKTILYASLILNAVMLITALSLLIYIYATGIDPNKRLTSHFATITLSLLPIVFYMLYKQKVNLFLLTFYTIYICIAVFLGSSLNFYNMYESLHYDKLVHVYFGYSSALVGLYALIKTKNFDGKSLFFLLMFIFSFAMMIAAVWEIFEFTSDRLIGSVTQGRPVMSIEGLPLVDVGETMFDIIANLIGAVLFMIQLSFYHKIKKAGIMKFMITELSK